MFFSFVPSAIAQPFEWDLCDTVECKIRVEFQDAPVMLAIARAESEYNPLADNPDSTASGVFQILNGTWTDYGCTGNVWDEDDNIDCARIIYDESGTRPWDASKDKWGQEA